MNKKIVTLMAVSTIIVLSLLVAACSSEPTPTATPIPTPTPHPLSKEERIQIVRDNIHKAEIASPGIYYKSWAFLDRREKLLDITPLTECAPSINIEIYDENGNSIYKNSGQSFVYGSYVFALSLLIPSFELRPPSPPFPGMSKDEYERFVDEYNKNQPDPSKFTIRSWIEWERAPRPIIFDFVEKVDIENKIIAEKLDELGIAVFRRNMIEQTHSRPRCLNTTIGEPDELEKLDILAHTERLENKNSIIKGSVMSLSREKHGFYFQGSIIRRMLGSTIYAFRKTTQEPELMGIVTLTGDPLESRGFAVSINYILELMDLAGIDATEIPDEPEEES